MYRQLESEMSMAYTRLFKSLVLYERSKIITRFIRDFEYHIMSRKIKNVGHSISLSRYHLPESLFFSLRNIFRHKGENSNSTPCLFIKIEFLYLFFPSSTNKSTED